MMPSFRAALLLVFPLGLPGGAAGQEHAEHCSRPTVVVTSDDQVPATAGWGLSVLGIGYLTGVMPGGAVHIPLGGAGSRPQVLNVWASPFPDDAGWAAGGDVTWPVGALRLGLGLVAIRDGSDTLFGPGMLIGVEWLSAADGVSVRYAAAYRAYTPEGGLPMLTVEVGLMTRPR